MIRNIFLLLFYCCLFSCSSQKPVKKPVATHKTTDIVHFAEQAWESTAQKIPTGREQDFGFNTLEEIQNSTVGEPIRMFYWQDETMITSNMYRVPILVDGKMVALLTVSANEDMTSDDFGGAQLARNIQLISDEYQVKITGILRIHPLSIDFLIFDKENTSYFIPATPQTLRNLSQRNILERNEVVTLIRSRLSDQNQQ
jgi:hypothetical protein